MGLEGSYRAAVADQGSVRYLVIDRRFRRRPIDPDAGRHCEVGKKAWRSEIVGHHRLGRVQAPDADHPSARAFRDRDLCVEDDERSAPDAATDRTAFVVEESEEDHKEHTATTAPAKALMR